MSIGITRQWTAAAIALVLLGFGSAGSATAEASNDTMATAEGPATGSIIGAINTENDVDWYFMYALGATQLDVALTGVGPEESCWRWAVELKDSNGYELSYANAYFNEVDHIRYTLPDPGTYYLEVSGFRCEDVGNYRIDLVASPALLTSPPYVPPPAPSPESGSPGTSRGDGSYAKACRNARQRISRLSNRLRSARGRKQRNRLRAKLRRARSEARTYC